MTLGYKFNKTKDTWKSDGDISGFMKVDDARTPPLSLEIETALERMVERSNQILKDELGEELRNAKQSVEALRDELNQARQIATNQNSYGTNNNAAMFQNTLREEDDEEDVDIISRKKPSKSISENFDVDDYMKRQLFVGSTHRYLFMDTITNDDGTTFEVRCNEIFIGIAVLVFQFVTYACIGLMGFNEGKTIRYSWSNPTLEIASEYCYDTEEYGEGTDAIYEAFLAGKGYGSLAEASIDANMITELLSCSSPADKYNSENPKEKALFFVRSVAATILLASFLVGDVFEGFALWRCKGWRAKAVSCIILFEAVVALNVAFMGVDLVEELGMLSSFLLFVGLIFVHDVDERLGAMQDLLNRLKRYHHKFQLQFWIFCVVFFLGTQGYRWFIRQQMSKWI